MQAAKDAFPKWRDTPVSTRARVMLKLQHLINENMVRRGERRQGRCAGKRGRRLPGVTP